MWPTLSKAGKARNAGGGKGLPEPLLAMVSLPHSSLRAQPAARPAQMRLVALPNRCVAAGSAGNGSLVLAGGRVWRGAVAKSGGRAQWLEKGEQAGLYTLHQAVVFGLQNFTHVVAAAGPTWQRSGRLHANRLYIGSFTGAYRSDDGGRTWLKLDPLSSLMQSLVVAPSLQANGAHLVLCTHRLGCWHGDVSIPSLRASGTIPPHTFVKGYPGAEPRCHGSSRIYSPAYTTDGLVFASCAAPPRLFRSTDRGASWSAALQLPVSTHFPSCSVDNAFTCREFVIQGYAFSPTFGRGSSTMYIAGYALGVAKSTDGGSSFATVLPSRTVHGILKACKVVVAPHSEKVVVAMATFGLLPSERMSARIDGETSVRGHRPSRLFLSKDGGKSWTPMEAAPAAWETVAFGAAASGASVLFGVRTARISSMHGGLMRGELVAHTCRDPSAPFTTLPVAQPRRSEGFGYQGLLTMPGGRVLASYLQGGVVVARVDVDNEQGEVRLLGQHRSLDGLWNTSMAVPMWSFSMNNHPPDNMMRYSSSPTLGYANGVLFGASYYAVMISLDLGRTWQKVYELRHSSRKCNEPPTVRHCQLCMSTEPRDCIICEPGYVRTPWPAALSMASGTAGTSRRCCHAITGKCDQET